MNNQKAQDVNHLIERMFSRRRINPQTGCWEWQGSQSGTYPHYGLIRARAISEKQKVPVHRAAAHLWLGFDLNSPLVVCHRCDNGPCFNPEHLFIGTQSDNMQDCVRKGRLTRAKGDGSPNARLSVHQVRRMKLMFELKVPTRRVVKMFPTSHTTVRNIRRGITWSCITL